MFTIRSMVLMIIIGVVNTSTAGLIYSFDVSNPSGSDAAGDIHAISTQMDSNTGIFSWSHAIAPNSAGNVNNGFWLVVTDGENPKGDANEYAIMFGDFSNSRLSVYEYSGANNANSWRTPGNLLAVLNDALTVSDMSGVRMVGFSLNTGDINANRGIDAVSDPSIWRGLSFAERVGIWFHPSIGTEVVYDDNRITGFSYDSQGWYDTRNRVTQVSEPSTLLMFGVALLGFGLTRHPSH